MSPLMLTLQYLADAAILSTYAWMVVKHEELPFHRANAFGGALLIITTLNTVGWVPLLVLTVAFTVLGFAGIVKGES
jgi:hypothetical protein